MYLKPVFIEAQTLDDCWHQLLYQLYKHGRRYKITSGSFEGHDRVAFDYVSGFIMYPHIRPLSPLMPEGSNLPAPTNDEDIEFYFSDYLMDSKLSNNEHYKYASWIVGDNNICKHNQLQWVIDHFKEKGYGNEHCTIMIGGGGTSKEYNKVIYKCPVCHNITADSPNKTKYCLECYTKEPPIDIDSLPKLVENETIKNSTPCLRMLDFRIVEGYLTTNVVYRSWDLYGGFPVNMGGFTLLNEYIASELDGVEPGPLSFSCKSLHCYDFHLDIVKQRLNK